MRIIISILLLTTLGCSVNNQGCKSKVNNELIFTPQFVPGPPTLVYKTRADYYNKVPVILSEDKTKIVSYPNPIDLIKGNSFGLPTPLSNEYMLDNRGIGTNVAFLKLTYEEYSKLQKVPSVDELYEMIIDKNPLLELCDCGNKNGFKDINVQLNRLIEDNLLRSTCKVVK